MAHAIGKIHPVEIDRHSSVVTAGETQPAPKFVTEVVHYPGRRLGQIVGCFQSGESGCSFLQSELLRKLRGVTDSGRYATYPSHHRNSARLWNADVDPEFL